MEQRCASFALLLECSHCSMLCGIRVAKMRFAVVVFPGTWSDHDTHHALTAVLGQEADLLPGALMRNDSLQYRCVWVHLRVENVETPFTNACRPGQVLRMPISHGEGRYVADEAKLAAPEAAGRGGV